MDGFVYVKDGHLFEADKDGGRLYVEDSSEHGGPHCVICDCYWCEYCSPQIFEEICPGRADPTLDGLEYRQPMITGVVGRRIYDADIPTPRRLRR